MLAIVIPVCALLLSNNANGDLSPLKWSSAPVITMTELVDVGHDKIAADFLTADASRDFCEQASQVISGPTPLPGLVRNLDGSLRAKLYDAIVHWLEKRGNHSVEHAVSPHALHWADVFLADRDVFFEVKRVQWDQIGRVPDFTLACHPTRACLPFHVFVEVEKDATLDIFELSAAEKKTSKHKRLSGIIKTPKIEYLVHRGQKAELRFQSGDVRVSAQVVSLDNGTIGQRVRVRNPQTGRVLAARVYGVAILQALEER